MKVNIGFNFYISKIFVEIIANRSLQSVNILSA
jgi:hypothetical protein